jgi:hypothetical protein
LIPPTLEPTTAHISTVTNRDTSTVATICLAVETQQEAAPL